jgi:hypothetical protein
MFNDLTNLILTDFGSCLDLKFENKLDFKIPYTSSLIKKGGSTFYLPPGIIIIKNN